MIRKKDLYMFSTDAFFPEYCESEFSLICGYEPIDMEGQL